MALSKKPQNNEINDEYDFDFSVLWQDEEQSSLTKYILPALGIILLIIILAKVW